MASIVASLGLSRVPRRRNPRHVRDGCKSYCYALQKYGITPTQQGPYWKAVAIVEEHQSKLSSLKDRLKEMKDRATHAQQVLVGDKAAHEPHHGHHETRVLEAYSPGYISAEDIQHDAEYLCQVDIGTPAQKMNLDFDTGSSDLWLWSTKLPHYVLEQYGGQHNVFDPSLSTTYKPKDGFSWKIQYGDSSSASGVIGNDVVHLGGLKIPFQAVELANNMSAQFQQGAGDGLLGLAFDQINTAKPRAVHTPVENMIRSKDVPEGEELFTAYLGSYKDTNEKDHGNSFYTFGYIDKEALAAAGVNSVDDIYYTDVDTSNGFWQFPSTQTSVNGHAISLPNNTAIADTGTTLALVSDKVCQAIYSQVPGATYSQRIGGYIFPSTVTADQLPVVKFAVGNKMFAVQKEDLAFADAGHGWVYGGIQSNGNFGLDILGDTFLKGIYAIFDQGRTRFGAVQRIEQFQNLSLHEAKKEAKAKPAVVHEAKPETVHDAKPEPKHQVVVETQKSAPKKEEVVIEVKPEHKDHDKAPVEPDSTPKATAPKADAKAAPSTSSAPADASAAPSPAKASPAPPPPSNVSPPAEMAPPATQAAPPTAEASKESTAPPKPATETSAPSAAPPSAAPATDPAKPPTPEAAAKPPAAEPAPAPKPAAEPAKPPTPPPAAEPAKAPTPPPAPAAEAPPQA